MLAREI